MELRQIEYLIAVAEAGNFTRAAKQCHIAQPSLSQQILKLEDELGTPLFHRHPRRVELTDAGREALKHARAIRSELTAFSQSFDSRRKLLTGSIRIGIIPTIAPYLLPRPIGAFRKAHPGVKVAILEERTSDLLKRLTQGEIDFAIASDVTSESKKQLSLHVRTLFSEEMYLTHPPSHPLAGKKDIQVSDIPEDELLTLSDGHCLADQVLKLCPAARRTDQLECGQLETILSLVSQGLGVTVAPAMASNLVKLYGLEMRRFREPRPLRIISLVRRRAQPLSRAAEVFLEGLSEPGAPS